MLQMQETKIQARSVGLGPDASRVAHDKSIADYPLHIQKGFGTIPEAFALL